MNMLPVCDAANPTKSRAAINDQPRDRYRQGNLKEAHAKRTQPLREQRGCVMYKERSEPLCQVTLTLCRKYDTRLC